jgi:hypothetical protein
MSWMHVWIHIRMRVELILMLMLICPVVKGKGKESTFAHHVGRGNEGSIRVRVRVVGGRVVPG